MSDEELAKQADILNQLFFTRMEAQVDAEVQEILNKCTEKIAQEVYNECPVDDGSKTLPHLRDTMEIKKKYHNVKYIGFGKTVYINKKKGLESGLINIVEYSRDSKHRGFLERIVNRNVPYVANELKSGIEKIKIIK